MMTSLATLKPSLSLLSGCRPVSTHACLLQALKRTATVSVPASAQTSSEAQASELKHVNEAPLERYNRLVKMGKLNDDQYQREIIESLGFLYKDLTNYKPPFVERPDPMSGGSSSFFSRVLHPFQSLQLVNQNEYQYTSKVPKGIYLYGDVGCGKTMLMDLFYECIPTHLSKKRLHFHQFMQLVHKRCHEIIHSVPAIASSGGVSKKTNSFDPIPTLAYELSQESNILCFDEFQVTDVADAMILRRLISQIVSDKYGVIFFATSNREPDALYINGVQRESFIPCIELLKSKNHVIFLNSPTDYRKIPKPISSVYYIPPYGVKYASKECVVKRGAHITQWYNYFAQTDSPHIKAHEQLTVWGRKLDIPHCTAPYVAQFSFKQLCGGNLAAGDYLELAKKFKAFIVTDIPYLSVLRRDEVRRFITFLDAVYDNHGKLATTAAAKFTDLFEEPDHIINDFEIDLKEQRYKPPAEKPETEIDDVLVSEHGFSKEIATKAKIFALDEERFAFARALSRLAQMSTTEWVERT